MVVLTNLIFSYYIGILVFIYGENYLSSKRPQSQMPSLVDNYKLFSFTFILGFRTYNLMAIFIMTICILFFVPVSYVLWVQIKNRGICKKRNEDLNMNTNTMA